MESSEQPLVELSCSKDPSLCPALRGFELELHRGESLAVSGPPGVGKTFLLRLIAGLEPHAFVERVCRANLIGFVFQTGGLVSNLSIRENISLPLAYHRLSMVEAEQRTDLMIERFRLNAMQHERPTKLSAEQRRMSQIARAAALDVDLLLLDELFLALSSDSLALVDEWLRSRREESGMSVVMVSHLESSVRLRAERWFELEASDSSSMYTGGAG